MSLSQKKIKNSSLYWKIMILSLGFSLKVEISGNMNNQRNPFSHKSGFVTSAQVLCFINTPGPKCLGMQISKTNDFVLNVRCIFSDVYVIWWKTYISDRKTHVRNFPRPNWWEIWSKSGIGVTNKIRLFCKV